MFGKKLKPEDQKELKKRTDLISQHILIAQAIELQKQVYVRGILPKYGLDMNKDYEIDLRSGKIVVAKPKQPQ